MAITPLCTSQTVSGRSTRLMACESLAERLRRRCCFPCRCRISADKGTTCGGDIPRKPFQSSAGPMTSHNTETPVRFHLPFLLAAALLGAAFPGVEPLHAQQADVVRGRVIAPDSVPVEGARVTVTPLSGNVSRGTRTDKNGRFTVTFPNGVGDYRCSFAGLGFAVKRFEVKRAADEET